MNPIREYHPNGKLMIESWIIDGNYHRIGGPAVQEWHENGQLWYEIWFIDGQLHRLDGPAFQHWHKDGQLMREDWRIEDKRHRLDGPAFQRWHRNGTLASDSWWIDGEKVESIEDPLAWALWIAKTFGDVHGLEKFCLDNIKEKAARAILASAIIV